MSDLDKLYEEAKIQFSEECWDGDELFKFDFAFALLAFCSDWHSGMMSELYKLSSALSIEWQFEPKMSWYDEEEWSQKNIYDWLEEKFREQGEIL